MEKAAGAKVLTAERVNPNLRRLLKDLPEGVDSLALRADQMERDLDQEPNPSRIFSKIIRADLEDLHALGYPPLTILRQVLSGCARPALLESPRMPPDVLLRCQIILEDCGGRSAGSYSYSEGVTVIRNHVSNFISERDGIESDPQNIILVPGSTEGLRVLLNILNHSSNGKPPAVLVPVPRCPLYSVVLMEFGISEVSYFLSEDREWTVDVSHLKDAIEEAKKKYAPRALIVCNPGNPTGSLLQEETMMDIVRLAWREKLVLIADEVYQSNIYDGTFRSFRKATIEAGPPYCRMLEVASLMSISSGFSGECGLRGGYIDLLNFKSEVIGILLKSICIKMCPSVLGQAALDVVVNPPKEGEPSYALYREEKTYLQNSFAKKARFLSKALTRIPEMTCSSVKGSFFAFPRLKLPKTAVDDAKEKGIQADFMYCKELLDKTGICAVPGSRFGQRPGTHHLRLSILPSLEDLESLVESLRIFHLNFINKYK